MNKHYFWGLRKGENGKLILYRFRSLAMCIDWCEITLAERIPGTHPEVRRIQRRIAKGEQITFPVEV